MLGLGVRNGTNTGKPERQLFPKWPFKYLMNGENYCQLSAKTGRSNFFPEDYQSDKNQRNHGQPKSEKFHAIAIAFLIELRFIEYG